MTSKTKKTNHESLRPRFFLFFHFLHLIFGHACLPEGRRISALMCRCVPARPAARMAFSVVCAAIMLPDATLAQSLSIDLGDGGGSLTQSALQIVILLTVLSLAPSILVMMTSFTRIIVVLSLLRTALGLQTAPPNVVMTALALFLTAFIMAPVFQLAYHSGVRPLIEEQIDYDEALERSAAPFRSFMMSNVREKDIGLFVGLSGEAPPETPEALGFSVLLPAFMISELRRAFEIGFILYLPFLIIDLVVASVLMSMGMMMLPPVIISLPFKLIFFVLVDGWNLIAGSLVRSFGAG